MFGPLLGNLAEDGDFVMMIHRNRDGTDGPRSDDVIDRCDGLVLGADRPDWPVLVDLLLTI